METKPHQCNSRPVYYNEVNTKAGCDFNFIRCNFAAGSGATATLFLAPQYDLRLCDFSTATFFSPVRLC